MTGNKRSTNTANKVRLLIKTGLGFVNSACCLRLHCCNLVHCKLDVKNLATYSK